ncbi:MAG: YceD family protein [Enterocloster bolteae]
MLINLSELFPVEGKSKTYTPELEMTQFRLADTVYDIAEKGPLSLVITNRGNKKLALAGTVDLVLIMPCARCLDPVRVPFHLEIDQKLDMNQSDEERVEDLDEQPYVNGYKLDIDQLVGNELTLNLPMAVLCSDDCKGICDRCGTNLNHETCDCDNRPLDPRMSVIQDIFKQSKEV